MTEKKQKELSIDKTVNRDEQTLPPDKTDNQIIQPDTDDKQTEQTDTRDTETFQPRRSNRQRKKPNYLKDYET